MSGHQTETELSQLSLRIKRMVADCQQTLLKALVLPPLGVPSAIVEEADALRARLERLSRRNTKRTAIVGRFSSGKSALINALIGEPLLASNIEPTSAYPVRLINGKESRGSVLVERNNTIVPYRITRASAKSILKEGDLNRQPAVEGDPTGPTLPFFTWQVRQMEIVLHISFLPSDAELVDTPGLQNPEGTEGDKHQERALAVLASVDRVVIVTSPNGLHEEDIQLLELAHHRGKEAAIVHNKADLVPDPEDRRKVAETTRQTLQKRFPNTLVPVLWVSAEEGRKGREAVSGIPELRKLLASDWFHLLHPFEELLDIILRWRKVIDAWKAGDWFHSPANGDTEGIVAYLRQGVKESFQEFAVEQLEQVLNSEKTPEGKAQVLRQRLPILARAGISMPEGAVRTTVRGAAESVEAPIVRQIGDTFLNVPDMDRAFAGRLAAAGFGDRIPPTHDSIAFWQFRQLIGANRQNAREELAQRWQAMPEEQRLQEFARLRESLSRRVDYRPDADRGKE